MTPTVPQPPPTAPLPLPPPLQTAQLNAEAARASLLSLATDPGLAGAALAAEVSKLVRLGLKAPNDFWERAMSERSAVIMASSNRHAREKAALERQQQQQQVGGGAAEWGCKWASGAVVSAADGRQVTI